MWSFHYSRRRTRRSWSCEHCGCSTDEGRTFTLKAKAQLLVMMMQTAWVTAQLWELIAR